MGIEDPDDPVRLYERLGLVLYDSPFRVPSQQRVRGLPMSITDRDAWPVDQNIVGHLDVGPDGRVSWPGRIVYEAQERCAVHPDPFTGFGTMLWLTDHRPRGQAAMDPIPAIYTTTARWYTALKQALYPEISEPEEVTWVFTPDRDWTDYKFRSAREVHAWQQVTSDPAEAATQDDRGILPWVHAGGAVVNVRSLPAPAVARILGCDIATGPGISRPV